MGNGSEPLLSSCIPNLQFNFRTINIEHFNFEIDSNCCNIALSKFTFTKCSKKVSLSDSTVSNNYDFEYFYLLLIFLWHSLFLLNFNKSDLVFKLFNTLYYHFNQMFFFFLVFCFNDSNLCFIFQWNITELIKIKT